MPLVVEHVRLNKKTALWEEPIWNIVEHEWTWQLLFAASALIEEDAGPAMAHGSGYGDLYHRPAIDHTFTQDYPMPDGEPIRAGDRIRMWREQKGLASTEPPLNPKGAST